MNKFSSKKLGEVLAFTRIGLEILSRGRYALEKVLGKNSVDSLTKMTKEQQGNIEEIALQQNVMQEVREKSNRTEDKLKQMQDLYLQDKWDDESELLEWLGFFEGAALVHWKLVEGVAEHTDDGLLTRSVNKGLAMHQDLLFKISEAIRKVGKSQAVAV